MRRSWMLIGLLVGGCADVSDIRDRPFTDSFQQSPTDQVDILWVVDNSNSMRVEQDLLAAGFGSFASRLEDTGANFHIGVITTDFDYTDPARGRLLGEPAVITAEDDYVNMFTDRVIVGVNGSGKEKGLEAAAHALSPTMTTGPNDGFLRQQANLLVVFVSDEDDCSDEGALGPEAENTACYQKRGSLVPVEDYVEFFQGLKDRRDKVQVGAIVGPEQATALCDDTTLPGTRYIETARLTGGISGSICDTDWSNFLFDLGLNAAGIFTIFELSHGAQPDTLEVMIDGDPVPESGVDGYTYDDVAHTIEFHGIWVPQRGSSVTADYLIESGT